ncbi:divergent polysaccharide deacetylase family protein [Geobacter hydrogenophilus]|uniref:divergent polysaccharide deacetylase family protein n=1 Tax=Geobacter hydrogenophilus TaxID=40983 RepID=UPI001BD98104|nr:divergent polysaccharide deacetylase family protein [Geobacter hydrogenophilus]MBT0893153.1 divergent polysaccharide deacetylase family protein [Geobacter hydrogenophilus]
MAKSRNDKIRVNRKKGGRSLRPILIFIVLATLAVASVFLIDGLIKDKRPATKPDLPKVMERHKLPPRDYKEKAPVIHEDYTATVVPPPSERHARPRPAASGSLAIIIDDMGKGTQEARSLIDIGVPVTFSIIPGLPKARQVAQEAQRRGIEVMIHLPMEPKGYPERRLEENGLLLSQGNEEISARMNGYFREVPQAVGANNHMGSAFTENREKMAVVLGILKEKGLFFVDSKTSAISAGESMARELGVRTASRAVFLDNIQDVGYISKQLRQAAAIARKRGSAIAICHPHPATIQALSLGLPKLRDEGITFVLASSLVH